LADIRIFAKPSSLYRYRPLGEKAERELEALVEGYIYCPPYSKLNDPMEGKHRLSPTFQEALSNRWSADPRAGSRRA
jgi:hypothetical protein